MNIKSIQKILKHSGYYSGEIDGISGPKTSKAVADVLAEHDKIDISLEKSAVMAVQLILYKLGYEEVGAIDGLFGPSTEYAFENWEFKVDHNREPRPWRKEESLIGGNRWPLQNDLDSFYGAAGGDQCTRGKVNLPFEMKLDWDREKTITRFSCHELVADSLEKIFNKINSAYSPHSINAYGFNIFGGCYNYRKMRGGSKLSTHSWGIAVDIDPSRNKLRWGSDKAFLAKDVCDEYWRIWHSENWVSLGHEFDYDWMHVQAARV